MKWKLFAYHERSSKLNNPRKPIWRFNILKKNWKVIPLTTQVYLLLRCCHSKEYKVSHQALAVDKI